MTVDEFVVDFRIGESLGRYLALRLDPRCVTGLGCVIRMFLRHRFHVFDGGSLTPGNRIRLRAAAGGNDA